MGFEGASGFHPAGGAAGTITGLGTTNYVAKFTALNVIGDSQIFDDGTNVGIGIITPGAKLDIFGVDATSVNYGLNVSDSFATSLLYVRNDGEVGMNGFTIRQLGNATIFKPSGVNGYIFNNSADTTNLAKITDTGQGLFGLISDANVPGAGLIVSAQGLTSDVNKELFAALYKDDTDQDGVMFGSKQGVSYIQTYSSMAGSSQTLILGGRSVGTPLETLSISDAGNVGIDINVPLYPLHVYAVRDESISVKVHNPIDQGFSSARVDLENNLGNQGGIMVPGEFYGFGWFDNSAIIGDLVVYAESDLVFMTNANGALPNASSEKARITTAGDVGIGIIAPAARLNVVAVDGTIANTALLIQDNLLSELFSVRNDGRVVALFPQAGLNNTWGHTFAAPATSILKAFSVGTSGLAASLFDVNIDGSFAIGALAGPISVFSGDGTGNFAFTGAAMQHVGINKSVPSAQLHIGPSDGAAGNTHLKFSPGVLVAPANIENGAFEFDGNLFFTKNNDVRFGIGGTIFDHYADATTAAGAETDLYSDSIPANTFAFNGDKVEAVYAVEGTPGSSVIKLYFGGTLIYDSTAVTAQTNQVFNVTIIRQDANTVRVAVTAIYNFSGLTSSCDATYTSVAALTLTNPQILKITGQQTVGGSTTALMATIKYYPMANI